MHRALTAILILALLGGQLGIVGALLGRYHAQQEQQREIAAMSTSPSGAQDVQHLTIPRAERESATSSFVQIEENEFRYQGNLYDLVHAEWRGNVWHAWVIHDGEEEQYLTALAQTIKASVVEGEGVLGQQRPVGYRPLALAPVGLELPPAPLLHPQSFPQFSVTAHQGPYLEVPHPPPWA